MTQFLTRVELHGATHGDNSYDTLHKAMEAVGFKRTITGDNGASFHLPTAEYFCVSELSAQQVRDIAQAAADKTKKKNAVIVAQAPFVTYVGLTPV